MKSTHFYFLLHHCSARDNRFKRGEILFTATEDYFGQVATDITDVEIPALRDYEFVYGMVEGLVAAIISKEHLSENRYPLADKGMYWIVERPSEITEVENSTPIVLTNGADEHKTIRWHTILDAVNKCQKTPFHNRLDKIVLAQEDGLWGLMEA